MSCEERQGRAHEISSSIREEVSKGRGTLEAAIASKRGAEGLQSQC